MSEVDQCGWRGRHLCHVVLRSDSDLKEKCFGQYGAQIKTPAPKRGFKGVQHVVRTIKTR